VRQDLLRWIVVILIAALALTLYGCAGSPQRINTSTVEFYRLRVRLKTTSQGAMLTLDDTGSVLSGRLVESGGNDVRKGITMRNVWVGEKESAGTGSGKSVTVEYALKPEAANGTLQFHLKQRTPDWSSVSVYGARGSTLTPLRRLEHSGGDPLDFSVSLEPLGKAQPEAVHLEDETSDKMVWAFYYPWYGSLEDWGQGILQDRPEELYVSNERDAIKRHIAEAKEAGIDGFLSSWWGPRSYTDENLKTLLDVADRNDFQVGINFETLGSKDADGKDQPLEENELYRWLRYLISTYQDYPAWTKVNGKPLIVLWASNTVPTESWKNVIERLRSENLDATYIGHFGEEDPGLTVLDIFDGLHTYNVLNVISSVDDTEKLRNVYETTGRAVQNYNLLTGSPKRKIWAPTVMPGYDDHLIPDRTTPVLDRRDGAFYSACWDAALASYPDWVFITSWNEWWEHTYIEPSEGYGDRYLELTRQCSESWKDGKGSPGE